RRRADRPREAAVALERRYPPARADEALGRRVERLGAHARLDARLELFERRDEDLARARHLLDLRKRLLDDHRRSLARAPPCAPVAKRCRASRAALELLLEFQRRDRRAD